MLLTTKTQSRSHGLSMMRIPRSIQIVDVTTVGRVGFSVWMRRALLAPCLKKAVLATMLLVKAFFGRLKKEMFYNKDWPGVNIFEFMQELNDYISRYNEDRIKTSLGNLSPVEYRRKLGFAA